MQLPASLVAPRDRYGTDAAPAARGKIVNLAAMPRLRAGRTLAGARARVAAEVARAYLDALGAQALLELAATARFAPLCAPARLRRVSGAPLLLPFAL